MPVWTSSFGSTSRSLTSSWRGFEIAKLVPWDFLGISRKLGESISGYLLEIRDFVFWGGGLGCFWKMEVLDQKHDELLFDIRYHFFPCEKMLMIWDINFPNYSDQCLVCKWGATRCRGRCRTLGNFHLQQFMSLKSREVYKSSGTYDYQHAGTGWIRIAPTFCWPMVLFAAVCWHIQLHTWKIAPLIKYWLSWINKHSNGNPPFSIGNIIYINYRNSWFFLSLGGMLAVIDHLFQVHSLLPVEK